MSRPIRDLAGALAVLCCLAQAQGAEDTATPVLLDVVVNGQDEGVTALLRRRDGLLVSLDDLRKWRFRDLPPAVSRRGTTAYADLAAIAGLQVKIDEAQQRVVITAPQSIFERTIVEANGFAPVALSPQPFSAYVNYEIAAEIVDGSAAATGFADAGLAGRWGTITASALGQSRTAPNAVRLDSTYTFDDPNALTRLVLGDSVSRGSSWLRPIRFGGIQFGTDFGLQPNFISFPSPSFAGVAALPTVVQAYVNDALRYSGAVPQGPFDLRQMPVVTGAGDVELLIKDSAGVQRSLKSSYYVSHDLLRAGLEDYGLDAGFVRGGYGLESFSYATPFASAIYRRGISDSLTAVVHVQGSARTQSGGAGLTWVVGPLGEFNLAGGASRSALGTGLLGAASFTHIGRSWSVAASYQRAARTYVQIGAEQPEQQILSQAQLFGSVSFAPYGGLSASATELETGDHTRSRVAALNYDVPIGEVAYLSVFALASRNTGAKTSTTFGLQIVFPFGGGDSAVAGVSETDSRIDPRAEYRRDPPFGSGYGYRVLVAPQEATRADGQVTLRQQAGTLTGEVADTERGVDGRALATGSVAYAAGKVFAARELGDAFGVVSVSDYPGVQVYQENQLVGRTDAEGRIAVTQLRAYQQNRISIDPNDVPLDAQVRREVQRLVPALHGAALADFAVTATRGATVLLVGDDGEPLKPGIPVVVDGHGGDAFTGYGGEVYLAHAHDGTTLEVQWGDAKCFATLAMLPPGRQPRIGPRVCRTAR